MAVRRLTRDQIAKIVDNDPEAIRAFEDLFRQGTDATPAAIVALQSDVDGIASSPEFAYGLESLSWLQRIEDRLNRVAYGEAIKTADQVAAAINTATAITWNSIGSNRGVTLGSPASRIVLARAGTYKFDLSIQLSSTSAAQKTAWVWFAINGVSEPNSALIDSVALNNGFVTMTRSEFLTVGAGGYVEAFFAVDDVNLFLNAEAATAFAPAAPAALLTVTQVAP